MKRYHYRAQCREGSEAQKVFRDALPELESRMKACGARQLSLFHWGSQLFLYYESRAEQQPDPHTLFLPWEPFLEVLPGADTPRRWVPMTDIFHYQHPVSDAHWQRCHPASVPYARIARLKPEQTASYVFYHYQYQEERPGEGDKYGIIALHENWMFFYSEHPATIEPPPYPGKLLTSNTPPDWAGVMEPHFIPWENQSGASRIWLNIPLVLRAG